MRHYTTAQTNDQSLFFADCNAYIPLKKYALLSFEGEKATELLQGQVTSDVNALSPSQGQPTAMCTLQGRLLMTGYVMQQQHPLLILEDALCESILKAYKMPAMLARVNIQRDNQRVVFGLYCPEPERLTAFLNLPKAPYDVTVQNDVLLMALGHHRFLGIGTPHAQQDIARHMTEQSARAWHHASLLQHDIHIYPQTQGIFLPQRVGLTEKGHVSFNKGCYKGQEIIARMHYRSKNKHKTVLLHLKGITPPILGEKLLNAASHNEAGMIIDYALEGEHQYLVLAEVLIDETLPLQLEDGRLVEK